MLVSKRTADDDIYLKENRYDNTKEIFKEIAEILNLNKNNQFDSNKNLLDIGGATGEFCYYVRKINPFIQLKTIEYSQNMVNVSKDFLKRYKICIEEGDANNLSNVKNDEYDYVTTIGVTSIFDDFQQSFNEMIRVSKNGAKCLNFMLVNELPVDVIIRYVNPKTKELESGWNKFSISNIKHFLENHKNVININFKKHIMPFDLPKSEDLMRCWTEMKDGKRVLWNGLNMEITLYHILFEIKK